jgi:hypothetical protein
MLTRLTERRHVCGREKRLRGIVARRRVYSEAHVGVLGRYIFEIKRTEFVLTWNGRRRYIFSSQQNSRFQAKLLLWKKNIEDRKYDPLKHLKRLC